MRKIKIEKLILYQPKELNKDEMEQIDQLLKKDKNLFNEYQKLEKADNYYQKYLDKFEMPIEFKKEVDKTIKRNSPKNSFFNFKFFINYGSGFATACLVFFMLVSTNVKIFNYANIQNSETIYRSENKTENITLKPKQKWLITDNLFIKITKKDKFGNFEIINENNKKFNLGDKISITLLSLKENKISLIYRNDIKTSVILDNIKLKKGEEIILPQYLKNNLNFFEITKPLGKESLIFEINDDEIFEFNYVIEKPN